MDEQPVDEDVSHGGRRVLDDQSDAVVLGDVECGRVAVRGALLGPHSVDDRATLESADGLVAGKK